MTGLRIAGRIACVTVWFLSIGAGLGVAHGETRSWVGAINSMWATAGNWSPAGTPQNGDDLVFTVAGASTNNLPGLQVRLINFKAGHQIDGVGFTLVDGLIVNGPGTATLNAPVTLGADQTWSVDFALDILAVVTLDNHTLTMDNAAGVATFRAPTGTGAIVKTGNGTWGITTAALDVGFTGPMTVAQGRLWAIGATALGVEDGTDGNGTTVQTGASLYVTDYTTDFNEAVTLNGDGGVWTAALVFADSVTQRVASPITLNTSASISTDAQGYPATTVVFTSTAAIKGPGDLTILDDSTLVLESNLHTFGRAHFGGTGAGRLRMGTANALASTGGIDLAPAAALQLAGFDTTLRWIGGSGLITNGVAPAANLIIDNATTSTFSGVIQSVNDLIKQGAGEFVLAAASGHTGWIDVRGGTLRVVNPSAFGAPSPGTKVSGTATLVLDGVSSGIEAIALERIAPTDTPTLHVTAAAPAVIGGSLTLGAGAVISGAAGADLTVNGQIVSAGDLRISGVTLHATNGANAFQAGTVTVDAGATYVIENQGAFGTTPAKALHLMGVVSTNGPSVIVNSLTGTGTIATANTAYVEVAPPTGTNVFPGVITGEPTLVKSAAGTLRLTGTAALGWATVDGGELTIASQQITSPHLIVNPGATLAWTVPFAHAGDLTMSETGSGTGASTLAIRGGNVTLSGISTFIGAPGFAHVTGPHQLVLRGTIGGRSLITYGTGVTILDNTSNYLQQIVAGRDETPSGTGTIRLARSNALDHSGGYLPTKIGVDAGSTFDLAGFSQHAIAAGGTGRIDTGTASGVLTLDGSSAIFEGILAGPGRVVANVAPTVYPLKDAHLLTGTFEVNATLDVAANTVMPAAMIARGHVVTIESGSTLGALTLEGDAEYLRAGSETSATGITTGGLTLPAAATTKVWLTGTTPRITVNGSVHLAGAFTYSTSAQVPLPTPTPGNGGATTVVTIIENDGSDPIVGSFATHPEGSLVTIGGHEYRLSYVGGTGNDLTLSTGPSATLMTYHLAEGATGTFFDTDLLIANPTDRGVLVDVTFLPESGASIVQQHFVYAMSRLTLTLDAIAGLQDASFSTIVTPREDVPLAVERTMRWDASGYGGHTEKATAGPATTWYFAEGSEGFFRTFLLLANPHAAANVAHVQYLRQGLPAIARSYDLLPSSRRTIAAGDDAELIGQSFGMTITFDQPGVAERAMYFGTSPMFRGGHESAGATAPSATWLLAEGATGAGFETFILVANPGSEDAEVTLTFLPENGAPASITRTVGAASRITINPEGEGDEALAGLPLGPLGTRITATKPVIAERAQYWPLGPAEWTEAHNSFGVTEAAPKWALAEGRAGGPENYQTYILLANPGTSDANVTLTFLGDRTTATSAAAATPAMKIVTVPAQRRFNVAVDPTGAAGDSATTFGTLIASDQPIVVERAMYWNVNGEVWAAGTNATATRLP